MQSKSVAIILDIRYVPPSAIEKFDLQIEQWASDESVRHPCKNGAYFGIFVQSFLNVQRRFELHDGCDFFWYRRGQTRNRTWSFYWCCVFRSAFFLYNLYIWIDRIVVVHLFKITICNDIIVLWKRTSRITKEIACQLLSITPYDPILSLLSVLSLPCLSLIWFYLPFVFSFVSQHEHIVPRRTIFGAVIFLSSAV